MANRLEKLPLSTGGASGGAGGGGSGGSDGSDGRPTPPPGTPCFAAISARIGELWPNKPAVFVDPYWKVDLQGGQWVRVTGTCNNGYVNLSYQYMGTGWAHRD